MIVSLSTQIEREVPESTIYSLVERVIVAKDEGKGNLWSTLRVFSAQESILPASKLFLSPTGIALLNYSLVLTIAVAKWYLGLFPNSSTVKLE
jgi:hypothetical protein